MGEVLVELKNVHKNFGDIKALRGIDLSIKRGNIYGLLGHNGAGKTTIIRLIGGVLRADLGEISVFGLDPIRFGKKVRRKIGVLSENTGLYGNLTAYENLKYYGKMYGISNDELKIRIDEYLTQFGLNDVKNRLVKEFSTGMKKKLGIIRAVLHRPELLLLDEASNGLDPISRNEFHEMLDILVRKQNIGVVLCSHDLEEVKKICDFITIIKKGKNVFSGDLKSIISDKEKIDIEISVFQDNEKSRAMLKRNFEKMHIKDYEFKKGLIKVRIDKLEDANEIIHVVIHSGMAVYGVSYQAFDLEKLYSEIDKENQI
ncbi:ABC transporter ATP-binding protein [Caloranaerobacter sp. DY30410]|uniref:ABC transporter ATP-binding protein n=1 Tax=Caloranaerobacter sp. DY30410 TaxID=3238305 RepID=UPI003D049032